MSHETTVVKALYLFDTPVPSRLCKGFTGYLSQKLSSGIELLAYSETKEVFCVIDTNGHAHYLHSDDAQRYLLRRYNEYTKYTERRYVYPDHHVELCDHANMPALPQVVIDLIREQSASASPLYSI